MKPHEVVSLTLGAFTIASTIVTLFNLSPQPINNIGKSDPLPLVNLQPIYSSNNIFKEINSNFNNTNICDKDTQIYKELSSLPLKIKLINYFNSIDDFSESKKIFDKSPILSNSNVSKNITGYFANNKENCFDLLVELDPSIPHNFKYFEKNNTISSINSNIINITNKLLLRAYLPLDNTFNFLKDTKDKVDIHDSIKRLLDYGSNSPNMVSRNNIEDLRFLNQLRSFYFVNHETLFTEGNLNQNHSNLRMIFCDIDRGVTCDKETLDKLSYLDKSMGNSSFVIYDKNIYNANLLLPVYSFITIFKYFIIGSLILGPIIFYIIQRFYLSQDKTNNDYLGDINGRT